MLVSRHWEIMLVIHHLTTVLKYLVLTWINLSLSCYKCVITKKWRKITMKLHPTVYKGLQMRVKPTPTLRGCSSKLIDGPLCIKQPWLTYQQMSECFQSSLRSIQLPWQQSSKRNRSKTMSCNQFQENSFKYSVRFEDLKEWNQCDGGRKQCASCSGLSKQVEMEAVILASTAARVSAATVCRPIGHVRVGLAHPHMSGWDSPTVYFARSTRTPTLQNTSSWIQLLVEANLRLIEGKV